ncbi:hypothetical protein EP331_05285 [bacterium]|nr:MAG: hypothetical protein EP331_05285 [bacterium]
MSQGNLVKRVTSITAARSVSIVSALLVSMVLTRLLPENEYGAYRTVWILYSLMGPIITSALTGMIYFRAGQHEKRENTITSALIWSMFFSLFIALTMWLGFPFWEKIFHAEGLQNAFRNFSVYLFFSGITSSIEAIFVVKHRKKWLFLHNIVSNGIEFSSVVIPFYLGYSLEFVTLTLIAAPFARTLFLLAFTYRDIVEAEWNRLAEIVKLDGKYMIGLMFISMAGVAALQLDSWVIRWFYEDDAIFAAYVVGARKIPFLSALMASVSAALIVQIGSLLKRGEIQKAMPVISRISGSIAVLLWPVLALIFVFSEELMLLLFGGYEASSSVFRVYLAAVLVQFFLSDTVLLAKGRNKLVLKAGLVELVVNLMLSVPFVMWLGFTGPAWATLISAIVFVFYSHILVNKEFGIRQSVFAYIHKTMLFNAIGTSMLVFALFSGLKFFFPVFALEIFVVGLLLLALFLYFLNQDIIHQIKGELVQHDQEDI